MASGKRCGNQRTTLLEKEAYRAHLKSMRNPEKKTDNSAPPLPLASIFQAGIYVSDLARLDTLQEENKHLLRKINIINRTKGKVNSSGPGSTWKKTNFGERAFRNKEIESANLAIYERLKSTVPTINFKQMEKDYKEKMEKMILSSRYPEYYSKLKNPLDLWTICPETDKPMCDPSKRIKCYFDIEVPNYMKLGRIVFEIYRDFAPIAGDNFVRLCRGERGLSYKGSTFYWIAPGYACMGGNITRKGSSREISVYGGCFKDEGHLLRFAGPGVISTFNFKKGRNSSRFMITFRELTTQNERFVVFGRVIRTLKVLEMLKEFGSVFGAPIKKVVISECGVVGEKRKTEIAQSY